MSLHLAEISKCVAADAHTILVLDGAGWHQAGGRLVVPQSITLMPLPPYAPELNPVENIWEFMRANLLSHRVWETTEDILNACCNAWNSLIQSPERIASIAIRHWANVSLI